MDARKIRRLVLVYVGLALIPEILRALGWILPLSVGIASSAPINALAASGLRVVAILAIGWAGFASSRWLWHRCRPR
jgi:hypothetical protein